MLQVTNTSMQTPGSSSTNTRDSILLSTVHQGKQQQSPVCGLNRATSDENLLRAIEDLARTPPDTAAEYCVSPSYAAISATAQQRSSNNSSGGNGEKKCSLYKRILQEAAYTLPRTPNLPHRARVSHTPGMGVLRVCSEANEDLDLPLATHVPPSASTTPKQQHTHSEPPTYDVETGQHSSALGSDIAGINNLLYWVQSTNTDAPTPQQRDRGARKRSSSRCTRSKRKRKKTRSTKAEMRAETS